MCRIAAYSGPQIKLEQFLLDPPHGLMKQAWAPREMQEATLNADGYGFGWYLPDGDNAIYTHTLPIWSDINLPHLARSLSSHIWLANVRSATPGLAVNQANTQPFRDQQLCFIHNGLIRDFTKRLRSRFQQELTNEIQAGIQGNTDSEYLFALFRQHYYGASDQDLLTALRATMQDLQAWLDSDLDALLNIVISDGQQLCGLRHACNNNSPSLYLSDTDLLFEGAVLLASEALSDPGEWQAMDEHELVLVDARQGISRLAL